MGTAENEPLRLLIAYLTTSHYDRGERITPLERTLKLKLETMVQEIANEVIGEAEGLRAQIKANAQQALAKAMQDDAWLRKSVVHAIAKTIGSNALDDGEDWD